MKLFYAPASPYVRKVMVLLHEAGLADSVEKVSSKSTPMNTDPALHRSNPLAKMPALVLDTGETLFDSRVICEYLDARYLNHRFFPRDEARRWPALRRQAIGDGLLDAALITRYETKMRPEGLRWKEWSDGQWAKVEGALAAIEDEAPQLADTYDIGTITFACALGYLDFRFAEYSWRPAHPRSAAWLGAVLERPALRATMPRL